MESLSSLFDPKFGLALETRRALVKQPSRNTHRSMKIRTRKIGLALLITLFGMPVICAADASGLSGNAPLRVEDADPTKLGSTELELSALHERTGSDDSRNQLQPELKYGFAQNAHVSVSSPSFPDPRRKPAAVTWASACSTGSTRKRRQAGCLHSPWASGPIFRPGAMPAESTPVFRSLPAVRLPKAGAPAFQRTVAPERRCATQ